MAKFDELLDARDVSQSQPTSAADHLIPLKSDRPGAAGIPPRDLVARAISSAVIPGLLANGRTVGAPATAQAERRFTQAAALWDRALNTAHFQPHEIERFAEQTLDGDVDAATDYVLELCAMGIKPTDIMLGLLTPAIRLLGAWWEQDKRSFMDVTVGSIRLQQAMRSMMDRCSPPLAARPDAPVCMFSVAPCEQHTFGVQMLDNIFRLQGWQMLAPDSHDEADVLLAVAMAHIDVIALSTATDEGLKRLGPFVATVRRASANRDIKVLVGGPAIAGRPDIAANLGADATADDALGALETAARLLGMQPAAA